MKKLFFIVQLCLILSGCLSYQKFSLNFDYQTGRAERTYHDIRSQKGADARDYSAEEDWNLLKSMAGEEFGKDFDADVIKPVRAELFKEGEVLSGREIFMVQLPKAFPSKKVLLEKLLESHSEGLEIQIINREIFLFISGREIESTNGKIIKTEKNNIIVWPIEQTIFNFTVNTKKSGGESLLPFYLKEKDIEVRKEN